MSDLISEKELEVGKGKIVDSIWFDKIGIVKVWNGYTTKWYIWYGAGQNQEEDEQHIAQYGKPFFVPGRFLVPVDK